MGMAALDAMTATIPQERRELLRQRQTVIAVNSGLQVRELLKQAELTSALNEHAIFLAQCLVHQALMFSQQRVVVPLAFPNELLESALMPHSHKHIIFQPPHGVARQLRPIEQRPRRRR
jgi:hypothetical protein